MIKIEDLWYTYAGRDVPTLKGINLEIADGEFVLLAGPTGCGKSTLLKTLNGIIPHESGGRLSGSVHINGINTANSCMMELAQITGLVFQNPDDQIFSTVVEDEIAFGPENLCMSKDEIDLRVRDSLAMVGMSEHRFAPTATLSGGQKQRICIASMLAMMPRVMTLDEPISQLDPAGASEVMHIIKELNRRLNLTIVLVEHRLHEIAPLADRIILMDCGKIVLDEPVSTAFKHIDLFHLLGLRVPETVELCYRYGLDEQPLIVEDALEILKRNRVKRTDASINRTGNIGNNDGGAAGKPTVTGDPVISIRNMWFGYRKDTMVLKNINLDIQRGERVALMGSNGSGKSTLLMHMPAMLKPDKGKIEVFGQATGSINPYSLAGRVGLVFQNPDLMLFCDSVYEEAVFGPANLGLKDIELRASRSLEAMQILDLRSDTPQALSRGQRLRTAVASVLSMEPELILLDEPTTGQDRIHIEHMMKYFTNNGSTLVFCTHDVETAMQYATRIIVLSDGCVIADGSAREIFMDEEILKRASLKQPVSMEIAHGLGIKALLIDELPEALC